MTLYVLSHFGEASICGVYQNEYDAKRVMRQMADELKLSIYDFNITKHEVE